MAVSIETEVARKGSSTSFIAQVAEVEVDRETGRVKLTKFVSAHDVGTIINPLGHQGQIDGEAIMAIGSGLMEELLDDQGKVTTTNLGEYKIPNIVDIPKFTTVLVKGNNGPGPYEAKGIGEHANVTPPAAIANAVQDACGVRIFDTTGLGREGLCGAARQALGSSGNREQPCTGTARDARLRLGAMAGGIMKGARYGANSCSRFFSWRMAMAAPARKNQDRLQFDGYHQPVWTIAQDAGFYKKTAST
jgi:hypothetical protein